MADLLSQAGGAANKARRDTLAAIASGGQAARGAFSTAQGNTGATQQRALDQMGAAAFGAQQADNSAVGQALADIVRPPGDNAMTQFGNLGNAYGTWHDQMGSATGRYFDQLGQATSAARRTADEEIARAREAFEEQQRREQDLAKWEIEAAAAGGAEQLRAEAMDPYAQDMANIEAARGMATGRIRELQGDSIPDAQQQDELMALGRAVQDIVHQERQLVAGREAPIDPHQVLSMTDAQAARTPRDPNVESVDLQGGQYGNLGQLSQTQVGNYGQAAQAAATPDYMFQRQAAEQLGLVDPLIAAGMFGPPDAGEQVAQAQDQMALEYLQGPGQGMFTSPQQQHSWMQGQQELSGYGGSDPLPVEAAGAQMGVDPGRLAEWTQLPAFSDALVAFQESASQGMSLAGTNQQLSDFLIETYGHDYPRIRDLVTTMYAHLFAG